MDSFRTLKDFFIKHKWRYLFGILWLLVVDIIQLIVPQIFRTVTNLLEIGALTYGGLVKYSIYIVLTGLGIGLGRYFWRMYIQGTSRLLEYHVRNKLFSHLQALSSNYFNNHKTGDLMAHATNDINAVRLALGPGIVMITDAVFITVSAIIAMINTANLNLVVLSLFPLPFLAFMVSRFGKIIHKRSRKAQEAFSNLTDKAQENFSGVRVIKSFVKENDEIKKFTQANQYAFEKNINLVKIRGLFFPLIQFISAISFLIVLWYGGSQVISGSISLGDFVAFNSYLGLLIWPMMAIGRVIDILQRGAASMDRINNILFERPEILDKENALDDIEINGEVEFKNVSFKYPNSNIYALKDINFKIPQGNTLAIIGRTGSGKTTIVNLLLRLYELNEGEISVDGINISDFSLRILRENIGYVPQDNFLFSTSIEENISFSYENTIDREKVLHAAKISEVYDNIMDFPNKFDTALGERGVTLSGGQKQRLSISRAVIKEPSILILDDSLSAVDTETEEKILNNLNAIMKSRTTILIAHRISTIKNSDEIIVLDEGEIIERGTHEELLKANGLYNDIYEKQLLEDKILND